MIDSLTDKQFDAYKKVVGTDFQRDFESFIAPYVRAIQGTSDVSLFPQSGEEGELCKAILGYFCALLQGVDSSVKEGE